MSSENEPTNRQVTFRLDTHPSTIQIKLCAKIKLSVLKPLMEQINTRQIFKTYKHTENDTQQSTPLKQTIGTLQPSPPPRVQTSKKRKQSDRLEKEKKKSKADEDEVCFVPLASCVLQEKNIASVISVIQQTPALRLAPLGIMNLTMEPTDNSEQCTLFLNMVNTDETLKTMLKTIQEQDPWDKTQTKFECVPCIPLCDVAEAMGPMFSRTLKIPTDITFPVAELYIRDESNTRTLAHAKFKPLSIKKKKSHISKTARALKHAEITIEATLTVSCYSTQGIETVECMPITETGPRADKSHISEQLKSRLDLLNTADAWQQIVSQLTNN